MILAATYEDVKMKGRHDEAHGFKVPFELFLS
jgi:hypothetical protein